MKQHDNDNEPLSFITLCAATRNVVRYLQPNKKKDEESKQDPSASDDDDKRARENRRYVDQRLRELSAWEQKCRGN